MTTHVYRLTFFISFLAFNTATYAQTAKKETPQYRYAFKGYLRLFYENKSKTTTDFLGNILVEKERNIAILPTIAFSKYRANGQFFELSLTNFNFSHQNSEATREFFFAIDSAGNVIPFNSGQIPSRGAEIVTNHLGLRFEWNMPVFYNKNSSFRPFLGLAFDPSVFYQSTIPFTSAAFPTRVFELSNTVTVVPRLTYAVSERLFIDVNVPFSLVNFSFDYQQTDNPILPTFARETTAFNARLLSNTWTFHLGLGYKLN